MQSNLRQNLSRSIYVEDLLRRLFLQELKSENLDEFLAIASNLSYKFKEHKFITELLKLKDDNDALDEARYEFNALFVGPRRPKAVPYESAYFDYKTIFGEKTMQVRGFYDSIGLKVQEEKFDKFPDDFIGFELQCLYFLSFKALKSFEVDLGDRALEFARVKAEFINTHAKMWFSEFANCVNNAAKLKIWLAFGEFLNLYLQNEIINLKSVTSIEKI
ncbi:molecular chaperone TorD family protein [Campylobacter sp. faydin G-140]|uniref:TorD/DmsD family molecular chaperone n=1 Tax=Campylobacter anatolicus TaxID=2829105 RepID=UPI001B939E08|nr:molecular chaperone TorD family protein [Campylobacter anatolicus]MBR8466102.1 molecular chaperone TorD family protein [Campylobacter anatolicus]